MSFRGRTAVWLTLAACALVICTNVEARKRRGRAKPPAAPPKLSAPPAAATPSVPPPPPVEHVVAPISPHPAEPPVTTYGLEPSPPPRPSPAPVKPSPPPSPAAQPSPAAPPSPALMLPPSPASLHTQAARLQTFSDPLLGVTFRHTSTLTVAPPMPPVNAVLLAPASPPFRSNLAILVDNTATPLPEYVKGLGLGPTTNLTISARPSVYVTGTPEHPTLKLANAQAIVDCGPHKLLFTATATTDRFDAFQKDFRALLDTVSVTARAPLETTTGTPYRDPDGRFAFTLPARFARTVATGAENVRFAGPVEDGRQLMGLVQIVEKPKDWEATDLRLSVLKRGIPGGMTGMMMLAGRVLKRPGQPDALLMTFRYRPKDEEIHEAVLEVPRGNQLVKFTFRGPGDRWALYEAALGKSLETAVGL